MLKAVEEAGCQRFYPQMFLRNPGDFDIILDAYRPVMPSVAILGTRAHRCIGWARPRRRDDGDPVEQDPSPLAMERSSERHATDIAGSMADAVGRAALVVLAGPLHANLETLSSLDTGALVADVTSVKLPFVGAARNGGPLRGWSSHGRARACGPEAASAALFRGAPWVICDDGADHEDVERMTTIVRSTRANPIVMSAERHDEVVASVSTSPLSPRGDAGQHHLAQSRCGRPGLGQLFAILTRVASAEASWWPRKSSLPTLHR